FLKSLTLKGFKSFADGATLEFEPGVTVVVGPNGSGKSNVVDAVAWVLGAQGPRTLRSSKMEDVIFAGTAKRARLGRAEVSLTIDNSAGLLPIEFSEVRLTRALWRSGESEYSINGAPCRLLDIQELLSDTGVGRQQHTIVSQLQLDAILSSRPEDRRAVIEEAAAVSKHRRRKERAQRRLEATESALLRAQDLVKEVRRQLRPLERQAEAARRHAEVMEELVALRRHLYGRELGLLASRLEGSRLSRTELSLAEEAALAELGRLDTSIGTAEEEMDASRREAEAADLPELVSTAEGLRARASGLVALLEERSRGIERERAAAVDADVVAALEADAASLKEQLLGTEVDATELLPMEAELAAAEQAQSHEAAELEARFGASPGVPGGEERLGDVADADDAGARAAQARAEFSALQRATDQAEAESRRAAERAEVVAGRRARLEEEISQSAAVLHDREPGALGLTRVLEGTREQLTSAEDVVARAEEARRSADAERHRWSARAEALTQALDEARARAGARRLSEVDGVLGALVELVDVDQGCEAAFEAAAGEALSAVLMEGEAPARYALAHLAGQKAAGAVIALAAPSLRAALGTEGGPAPARALPEGAIWLRDHVRSARPEVTGLLDALLAQAVLVEGGWEAAVDLALERPELVVVSRQGDRCAGGIWRTGAHGTGATGAALEEALASMRAATSEAERAASAEVYAKEALGQARSRFAEAEKAAAEDAASARAATEALRRARSDLVEVEGEAEALSNQARELAARRARDRATASELQALLPELEAAAQDQVQRATAERAARNRLAERSSAVATLRRDLEVRASQIEERRALLGRRLSEVEQRLARHADDREKATERRQRLDAMDRATSHLGTFVRARLATLEASLEMLRELRREEAESLRLSAERLESLRRERAEVERELSRAREHISRNELEAAQSKARLEALTETVRRDLDCEPASLEGAECPPLPPGTSAPNRTRELERELRLMGPVNPLALEEHAALQERHNFLEGQLRDVSAARRELSKVIRAVDAEIITVFKAAYDDVAENFSKLVATLFPNGEGSLFLTDPSNILESGVDLEVRPAGKNIRRLSLLSGGERSLVALAFLFSVFRSRPSPFYMMDEVESALDDVNLHRFLDLVHEFRDEAQLLIVSHQKRTMEAADCLYGVSMPPGGSSLVVSEKVEREAPQPAAAATV
ncbi:MAG TPA: chromosome segregation protein SMC, partial [Acidimicrobiales bacterium]|nr:chromosome segregation protein SMC [Acidimicrobiales bacterium]